MTVHAAKGLEAPVVFVVDKCSAAFQAQHAPALFQWGADDASPASKRGYLWVPSSSDHGSATLDAQARVKELAEEEYRRLLYVAMTRAEDRLIICGYTGKQPDDKGELKLPTPNWHSMVSHALKPEAVEVLEKTGKITAWRWRADDGRSAEPNVESSNESVKTSIELPGWVNHHMPRETALPRPLNPSGAQALIDENLLQENLIPSVLGSTGKDGQTGLGDFARKRGTAIHTLLQVLPDLPEESRWQRAEHFVEKSLPALSAPRRQALLATVRSVVEDDAFSVYFDPSTSKAEVPVMGRVELASGPRTISGMIDRICVNGDVVTLLDYKTTLRPPKTIGDAPDDYITQMALYQHLIAQLYPHSTIKTLLVWTHAPKGPDLMEIPQTKLDAAFTEIANL